MSKLHAWNGSMKMCICTRQDGSSGLEKFSEMFFQYTWMESYMIIIIACQALHMNGKNGEHKKTQQRKNENNNNQKKFIEETRRLLSHNYVRRIFEQEIYNYKITCYTLAILLKSKCQKKIRKQINDAHRMHCSTI